MVDVPTSTDLMRVAPGDDLPTHAARAATTAAIVAARDAGARKLLVDFHGWHGAGNPSLALRIDSIFEWAEAASPSPELAVALVMPPQMVDPGRIGFILGHRLGFNFDVFGSVDEALAWLEPGDAPRRDRFAED